MLGVVQGGTGASLRMRGVSLLFNIFFAVILLVALERFSENAGILAYLAHLQEQPSKVGLEMALDYARRAMLGMLCADDTCIVSRSPRG